MPNRASRARSEEFPGGGSVCRRAGPSAIRGDAGAAYRLIAAPGSIPRLDVPAFTTLRATTAGTARTLLAALARLSLLALLTLLTLLTLLATLTLLALTTSLPLRATTLAMTTPLPLLATLAALTLLATFALLLLLALLALLATLAALALLAELALEAFTLARAGIGASAPPMPAELISHLPFVALAPGGVPVGAADVLLAFLDPIGARRYTRSTWFPARVTRAFVVPVLIGHVDLAESAASAARGVRARRT